MTPSTVSVFGEGLFVVRWARCWPFGARVVRGCQRPTGFRHGFANVPAGAGCLSREYVVALGGGVGHFVAMSAEEAITLRRELLAGRAGLEDKRHPVLPGPP